MKKYTIPALVLLTLLPVAAPASAQNKEHMQMEAELRMLQEQNQQLSLAFQQAMEAIKAVNGRFDAAMEAMRKGFADQGLATKNMAGDVSTIAERVRDNDAKLRALGDEITALQATLTSLATGLAGGGGAALSTAAPADPNAPAVAAAPTVTLPSTLGQSPNKMLEQAKGDYYRGQYDLAIGGFQSLINSQFANTEAAAEAQFWIGEAQFNQKKWPDAITAYNVVLQKSPRATYAPEALYKRGEAQRWLGDMTAARASYEQVIKQYPDSDSAHLAQTRLDGLPKPTSTAPARP